MDLDKSVVKNRMEIPADSATDVPELLLQSDLGGNLSESEATSQT